MEIKHVSEPLCNLCGLSCTLRPIDETGYISLGGLINRTVNGGYNSTAGNGYGALDDLHGYTFSLCEWCLDWLFERFKIKPQLSEQMFEFGDSGLETKNIATLEEFEPAEKRVNKDEWRDSKKEFFDEKGRRDKSRGLKINS